MEISSINASPSVTAAEASGPAANAGTQASLDDALRRALEQVNDAAQAAFSMVDGLMSSVTGNSGLGQLLGMSGMFGPAGAFLSTALTAARKMMAAVNAAIKA